LTYGKDAILVSCKVCFKCGSLAVLLRRARAAITGSLSIFG
jgi:hypothetical protein